MTLPEPQETEQTEQPTRSIKDWLATNRWLALFVGIVVLGVVALCVIAVVMLLSFAQGGGFFGGAAEPTPFPTTDAVLPLDREPVVVGVGPSDTISVTLDMPATISLGAQSFSVQPQPVGSDGFWQPQIAADSAAWVYGTVVNYVFGLPHTPETEALLNRLNAGDEMTMVTNNGLTFTFAFNRREEVSPLNRDIFSQQTPGMTVVLLGDGGENRLMVNGRFLDTTSTGSSQNNMVELGESVLLGNLRLTVNGTVYDPSRSEAPAGFAFFRIDYQVENVGGTAVDTANLRFNLADAFGNQYALNPLASQLGNHPTLSGFLNAGQTVLATAGYQMPVGLNSETVQWVVTDSRSGAQIQVLIPFAGGGSAAQQTTINLTYAAIVPEQNALDIEGQITNLSGQPLVVVASDLSLRTAEGAQFLMLSTNPPFPWTVPPGQTLQFAVSYQRPPVNTFVFNVLNQPFQLTLQP